MKYIFYILGILQVLLFFSEILSLFSDDNDMGFKHSMEHISIIGLLSALSISMFSIYLEYPDMMHRTTIPMIIYLVVGFKLIVHLRAERKKIPCNITTIKGLYTVVFKKIKELFTLKTYTNGN